MANISLPNITSYLTNDTINWARVFVDPWIMLFGSFFWGMIVCVFGVVIYLKTERIEPMIAWFILFAALGYPLFQGLPVGDPMSGFLYVIGIIAGISVGFLLYRLIIYYRE